MDKSFDFAIERLIYKNVDGKDLNLIIFNPENNYHDRTAILFFHGGSYVKCDRTPLVFQHHAELYASKGIVAICVDYRTANDSSNFSPLQPILDAKNAIQWVRQYHQKLRINPNKVIMCGASSGGYTVLCSIMSKNLIELEEGNVNNIPNALIMFNPGVDGVEITNRLFPELNHYAKRLSPIHNIAEGMPPMVLFIGTGDIIYDSNLDFYRKWLQNGNQCVLHTYEGMPHGFFNYGAFENRPFEETNNEVDKFLKSFGFL